VEEERWDAASDIVLCVGGAVYVWVGSRDIFTRYLERSSDLTCGGRGKGGSWFERGLRWLI
jgi:hypothetical protein